MAPSVQLVYFPARGRAEFLRLMAAVARFPLSERIVTLKEWAGGEKARAPDGSLPYLVVDGGRLLVSQHLAIGRFFATLTGLNADDAETRSVIERWVELANDLNTTFTPLLTAMIFKPEPEKVPELMREFLNGKWKEFCVKLNDHLQGRQWLGGNRLSWADCYVAEWVDRVYRMSPHGRIPGCVEVDRFRERFYAIPEVAQFVMCRDWVGVEGEIFYR